MSITVKYLDDQTNQVIEKAKVQGGYMVSSDIDRVTIRIPAEKLNSFMDEMATFGAVESRNIYSQDITDQYADMAMRVENAQKARKRYLELLEQATKVSDILAIEKELERLNGEIERLQGQINSFDKQVQYSSISIYFTEKVKPGPVGYIFVGLYKAVKFLFVRG
jgi:vacuolar-type H+-ATPase subunit D/Vma8